MDRLLSPHTNYPLGIDLCLWVSCIGFNRFFMGGRGRISDHFGGDGLTGETIDALGAGWNGGIIATHEEPSQRHR